MQEVSVDRLMKEKKIVIYDGECGFCNASVRFILNQKPSDIIRFVSHQSELGTELRNRYHVTEGVDSIIFLAGNQYYVKSKAIFLILEQTNTAWKYLNFFKFIPAIISDFCYDVIARNRHRINDYTCQILTEEEKVYFVG